MEAVADGSREALGQLYERHATMVFRAAYRVTGSRAEAEDVLHDVFVALPGSAARYRELGSFEAWLRTVSVRAALKRVRREPLMRSAPLEVAPEASHEPTDPVDTLALHAAIRSLPDALRVVFMLKEVEGYTHAEVAEMVGITRVTSRVRLHRAWSHLREGLGTE